MVQSSSSGPGKGDVVGAEPQPGLGASQAGGPLGGSGGEWRGPRGRGRPRGPPCRPHHPPQEAVGMGEPSFSSRFSSIRGHRHPLERDQGESCMKTSTVQRVLIQYLYTRGQDVLGAWPASEALENN